MLTDEDQRIVQGGEMGELYMRISIVGSGFLFSTKGIAGFEGEGEKRGANGPLFSPSSVQVVV